MAALSDDGFHIGDIYTLKSRDVTELIPRRDISYVSAKYQSKPAYLVFGVLLIIVGLAMLADRPGAYSGGDFGVVAIIVGALLVIAYFGSRRVGIIIASAGGRLFVETRSRERFALLQRIYDDLQVHLYERRDSFQ